MRARVLVIAALGLAVMCGPSVGALGRTGPGPELMDVCSVTTEGQGPREIALIDPGQDGRLRMRSFRAYVVALAGTLLILDCGGASAPLGAPVGQPSVPALTSPATSAPSRVTAPAPVASQLAPIRSAARPDATMAPSPEPPTPTPAPTPARATPVIPYIPCPNPHCTVPDANPGSDGTGAP
jgi:hypothetical protein